MQALKKKWFPLVVLVGITINLFLTMFLAQKQNDITDELKTHSIRVCENGRDLRIEVNKRDDIDRKFLITAANIRKRTARLQTSEGDVEEAVINLRAARLWEDLAREYSDVKIIDCMKEYNNE